MLPWLRAVSARLRKSAIEVGQERKIFGIGLSKTGTSSLTEALNVLGHDAVHWISPITSEVLSDRDFFIFGASTDVSVADQFEKLYHRYPNALFIWTGREVESWTRSLLAHHRRTSWVRTFDELRELYARPFHPHMSVNTEIHFGLMLNFQTPEEAYAAFAQRVRHFFADKPKHKLLELDIIGGQGWPELCGFLDVPVPEAPFRCVRRSAVR